MLLTALHTCDQVGGPLQEQESPLPPDIPEGVVWASLASLILLPTFPLFIRHGI